MKTFPTGHLSWTVCVAVAVALACDLRTAAAQTLLLEPRVATGAPSIQQWSFSDGLRSDSIMISSATQFALPVAVSFVPARDWRIGISGTYARGSVSTAAGSVTGESGLDLSGLTDLKIRGVGRLLGERLWVTVGLNLPTGRSGLSESEVAAIRILGAPALRLTTPVLGSGLGVIAGPVFTGRLGGWSVGLGLSVELRNGYTPLEFTLAGGSATVAEMDPAEAVHISLGVDRLVGSGKMAFLLVSDRYGTDAVTLSAPAGTIQSEYELGPSYGVRWLYRLTTQNVRDLQFEVNSRWRTEFSRGGAAVGGSAGSYIDAGVTAALGSVGGLGWVLGGVLSRDSGLDLDDALHTAAMTSAQATVGVELALGRHTLQPFLRAGFGSFDTGGGGQSGRLFGAGVTLRTEW